MSAAHRWIWLPVAALVLVAGVIGAQVANGGGRYAPLRPADPCVERPATSQAGGIDGLTERLVLLGLADAACTLGVSREQLTLDIARTDDPTTAQVDALRTGLLAAVRQMKADGSLPPASDLLDEALAAANLNGLLERVIRALPDTVVDGALKTDDVLDRAIDDLDLRALLANLDDQGDLERQVTAAVTTAVEDSLTARLRDLLP